MSFATNELQENFTPKDQKKNTAQTVLSREIIKQFANRRSDWEGSKQLAFHISLILFSQFLVYSTPLKDGYLILDLALYIFCGYAISFLFMGEHECVHHTAFKTPIYNDIVAYLYGFGCFRPPMHYKYYHWAHHRFTGNKEKDPELQNTFIDFDIGASLLFYLLYLSGIPFWIDRITCLLRHSLLFIINNIFVIKLNPSIENYLLPKELEYYLQLRTRRYNVSLEALLFIILYILMFIFFDVGFLWKHWIIPSVIGQVFVRAYLIAEHNNCKSNTDMFSNTRTTKTFWLESKLAWNMPWHIEHHAFPYVPFYLLPQVHNVLIKKVGGEDKYYQKSGCNPNGQKGYLSVHHQIINDIFNKQK